MWYASAAHPVADQLRQNRRAAALRMLQLFENQNARAFADDESVAQLVPRPAGVLRVVIALRKRAHGAESADRQRRNAGFRAAADHHIRIVVLDEPERIADRVRAGGARGRGGRVRAFRAGADGNVARRQIDDGRRNEKRRHAVRAFFEQNFVLALDHFESADAAADVDAGALGVLGIHLEARDAFASANSRPPRWRTG